MKEIRLWSINGINDQALDIELIENVNQTETENQLEEVITHHPDLLMEGLKIVGRQTDTAGGPLDLLGLDNDGRIVIFELKRGNLTRDAVAQIIDYASYLYELETEDISEHISSRSGNNGIQKIDNFSSWYQDEFGKNFLNNQRPRMILVGLGADEKTRRMVSFLSNSDLDISLITFHGFKKNGQVLLARQVEVESKPPQTNMAAATKMGNLEKLKSKVKSLNLEALFSELSSFFRDNLQMAYEWPNQSGYSYYLIETNDSGSLSNRVYVGLYVNDNNPHEIQILLHKRAIEVASSKFSTLPDEIKGRLHKKPDGSSYIWVQSDSDWLNLKKDFQDLCGEIIAGWKKKREQQSKDDFESADINE